MKFHAFAVAAFALAVSASAVAQWKWKDASGRVQYSDLPPPSGVAEKDILQRPASAQRARTMVAPPGVETPASAPQGPATPVGAKPVETELDVKRKKAEADEAAKRKVEEEKLAAAKADNCSRARGQMKLLDDGVRLARTGANGEREVLDDTQRADESRRVRSIIASDCK